MNIKKIVLLTFCNISLCFDPGTVTKLKNYFSSKHPVEKMYDNFLVKLPDLTKLINKQKYESITFERLYKNIYTIRVLKVFAINANMDSEKSLGMIKQISESTTRLRNSLLNTLISILDKPIELKKEEEKRIYQLIFELLPLAVGPEPTLLDLLQTIPEESVQHLSSLYSKLIKSMYETYIGIENEPESPEKNTNLEQVLHYAQQAYAIMKQYTLSLTVNEKIDLTELEKWLRQPNPPHTENLLNIINQKIEKQLKSSIKKVKQKMYPPTKKLSHYIDFIHDIDLHAEIVTLLFYSLHMHKKIKKLPWTNILTTYIQSISDYLNSIQDSKVVDLLPEAPVFRHYKDFLTKYIVQMLEQHDTFKKNFYVQTEQLPYMSDERINLIEQFINSWMHKYTIFDMKPINLQIRKSNQESDSQLIEEKIIKKLSASTVRTLLFYMETIAEAYKPEIYQWNPLNKEIEDDLIKNKVSIFAFWQYEIVKNCAFFIFDLLKRKNQLPIIEPYLLTYTEKSWPKQIKQHAPELLQIFEQQVDEKYFGLLSEYEFTKQKEAIPIVFKEIKDTKDIESLLPSIRKLNNKLALLKLNWTFVRFISQKQTLDIIKGKGITGTLHALDGITNFLYSTPHFTRTNEHIRKNITFIHLKKDFEQLLIHMHDLQNAIGTYLTSVLYGQTPNPLYQAYIKTGQLLITAIQKVIDLAYKKYPFLDLKPLKKHNFNFKQLDTEYQNKKLYL
ncbi:MAG TPA: hypothetical protein VL201_02470 [Patescibacteria group bacterium]|jgi:hypothetical protein|nr:hypothetical protein [Patescibacteria group bacterium]